MTENLKKKTRAELMALLDSLNIHYLKNNKKQVLIDKASAALQEVDIPNVSEAKSTETISEDHQLKDTDSDTSTNVETKPEKSVFGDIENNTYDFSEKNVQSEDKTSFEEKDQLFHKRDLSEQKESVNVPEQEVPVSNEKNNEEKTETKSEEDKNTETITRKEKYRDIADQAAEQVGKGRVIVDDAIEKSSSALQKTIDHVTKEIKENDKYLSNTSVLMTKKEYYLNLGMSFAFGMLFLFILKAFF